jgi:hypothetical protein
MLARSAKTGAKYAKTNGLLVNSMFNETAFSAAIDCSSCSESQAFKNVNLNALVWISESLSKS